MYMNVSKKKLDDFMKVLAGFEKALDIASAFRRADLPFKSKRLKHITTIGYQQRGRERREREISDLFTVLDFLTSRSS